MSLESVVKGILEAGRRESREIISEAKKEADKMVSEAKEKGTEEMKRRVKEAEDSGKRKRVQDLARAELEVKRIILQAQKDVLDAVSSRALEHLKSLPSNDLVLKHLLSSNDAEVKVGRVYSNEEDRMTVQSFVGSRYAGTKPILGGIIIESMDGKSTVDLTYETLMQKTWENSIREVAELLWPR